MKFNQSIYKKRMYAVCIPVFLIFFLSCAAVQKYLDRTGIESECRDILKRYRAGDPAELSDYIKQFSLDRATKPFNPGILEVRSIGKWKLEIPVTYGLVQEKIFFRTSLSTLTHFNDKLVLYVYRPQVIKDRKMLLFIPGMGVSNTALFFIKNFFKEILTRGYTLVVYIPPYHLERIPPGRKAGEGFFSHDTVMNSKIITGCTSEIRSILKYFRTQGVKDISAWGGSMGASFLLLSAQYEFYSHLTVMIPVLDWNTLLLDNPGFCVLKQRLLSDGYPEKAIRNIYNKISPMHYSVITPPGQVLIMAAKYDQLTSTEVIENYRHVHNNPTIKIYDRSHSTILTDYNIYSDYAEQLDMWDKPDR